jgi:hypothetical protein
MRFNRVLMTLVFLFVSAVSAFAQVAPGYVGAGDIDESKEMTQGQFAAILVSGMGLESKLPVAPTTNDYIKLLDSEGIRPLEGWSEARGLTEGDFAVILACAIGANAKLDPAIDICQKNREYIMKVWNEQYQKDGYRKTLDQLLRDSRFFPNGPPVDPYGYKYTDKNAQYIVDPVEIAPDAIEINPTVKYIYKLQSMGIPLRGEPARVLTMKVVRVLLQSPIFRSSLPYVVINVPMSEEHKQEVVPISQGGGPS